MMPGGAERAFASAERSGSVSLSSQASVLGQFGFPQAESSPKRTAGGKVRFGNHTW
jgi:hypothetical protein